MDKRQIHNLVYKIQHEEYSLTKRNKNFSIKENIVFLLDTELLIMFIILIS